MIKRLKNIEISNFRGYGDFSNTSLDADMVLLYGPNGSGKTSFLSAIELALTGGVQELKLYEKDYPRCLQSIYSNEHSKIKLDYLTCEDVDDFVSWSYGESGKRSMPTKNKQHFLERCYLSQRALSRLLELYEQKGAESKDTPIIAFVRELLGITELENLIEGLSEISRIDRVEKASVKLQDFSRNFENIRNKRDNAVKEKDQKKLELTLAIEKVSSLYPEFKCSPSFQDCEGALNSIITNLPDTASDVTKLIELKIRVEKCINDITNISKNPEFLNKENGVMQSIENDAKELNGVLSILCNTLLQNSRNLPFFKFEEKKGEDIISFHSRLKTAIIECADLISRSVEQRKRKLKETEELILQKVAIANDLEKRENEIGSSAIAIRKEVLLLNTAIEQVTGSLCPVCKRDYSEISGETLSNVLASRLKALGETAQRFTMLENEINECKIRLNNTDKRLIEIDRYPSDGLPLDCNTDVISNKAQAAFNEIENLSINADYLRILREQVQKNKLQEQISVNLDRQLETAVQVINDAAAHLSLSMAAEQDTLAMANTIIKKAEEKIAQINYVNQNVMDIRNAAKNGLNIFEQYKKANQLLANLENEVVKLQNTEKKRDTILRQGRELCSAAVHVKEKLLAKIFDSTLNSLWQDLYIRLTKDETFKPHLKAPEVIRRQIKTSIQGFSAKCKPFEQIASVLSSGNLNTAALTLFLSLNLIDKPLNHILVLDDPVQNMDDIHIINFATLLRNISRQSERQIIIALHEEALFNYLTAELAPTEFGTSLIAAKISNSNNQTRGYIDSEKFEYKKCDTISLGV